MASKSAAPRPMIRQPSTWLRRWSGLTIAPHSKADTARTTLTEPVARSTATSAQVAMYPPFSAPPAMPQSRPCAGLDLPQPNVELPGCQLAVLVDAGRGFDQTGGAEVGPGELLLAGPYELHRLSRNACQPGGLDRGLVGMLAAVATARIRYQHPDAILRHM